MRRSIAAALFFAVVLAGCATIPEEHSRLASNRSIELEETPFYPQQRYQCGPAALTTVLTAAGVETTLAAVTRLTYLPERRGSLQTELLAASRGFGRIPYVLDGTLSSIQAELAAGRPVLVLQNLGVDWFPRWHYAVVVGLDPDNGDVILRSGTEQRRTVAKRVFMRTWQRGEYWGFVALRPGELPTDRNRDRYLEAVAAVEETGNYTVARPAWKAALEAWPDTPTALFGLAHSSYQLEDYATAERTYRRLLDTHPALHAARNNLAFALSAQGRHNEAVEEVQRALASVAANTPFRLLYESSLAEIRAAQ